MPSSEWARRLAESRTLPLHRRDERRAILAEQVGERYAGCTFEGYRLDDGPAQAAALRRVQAYVDALADEHPGNLVLFGPPGTGKDHLMTAALFEAIARYGLLVCWRDGSRLWQTLRESFNGDASAEHRTFRLATNAQIFAISDPAPPKGEASRFFADFLQRVIDERYRRRMPTWATLNAEGAAAERLLSAPLVDRLRDGATAINCNWQSYRKAATT